MSVLHRSVKCSWERILEWWEGEVGRVRTTLAIEKNARETSSAGGNGLRPLRESFGPTSA